MGATVAAAALVASVGGAGVDFPPRRPSITEEIVSTKPLVVVLRNFASAEECKQVLDLIDRCHSEKWAPCKEVRSRLEKKGLNQSVAGKPLRNSTSFMLDLQGELDPAVDELLRRAHLEARHPITYGEGIQVASYHEGDYYQFHHDAVQRRATFLLYLTDLAEGDGGETIFPLVKRPGLPEDMPPPLPPAVTLEAASTSKSFKVDHMEEMQPYCDSDYYLKVRPEAGKAVIFYSYRPDYGKELYAIHGSCPIKRGHKAIYQRWMRFEENALYNKQADKDEELKRSRVEWGGDLLLRPAEAPATSTSSPEPRTLRGSTAPEVDTLGSEAAAAAAVAAALRELEM